MFIKTNPTANVSWNNTKNTIERIAHFESVNLEAVNSGSSVNWIIDMRMNIRECAAMSSPAQQKNSVSQSINATPAA
jgi:hypothetical protein